ncbi:alpha/beta hydrolase [Serpentinicella sp. ANB-PHB4]|uniref:alpha/beta hydrolase n=1 Tax=Serpentinicella sp. ANB-PHB4 TaxID=3074076 RepID=UPI002862EF62|nr:alpha/beta hydrolase [Serpentinicella sp. ANB-PHB4]MDR5658446.1 alpha/beta hydrolase [Serpentinicella sp. ANB-PHB4]
MIIFWSIILIAFLMLLGLSYYFSTLVVYPKTITRQKSYLYELEKENFDEKWFNELDKEEVVVDSPYGYQLKGIFIKNHNSKKTVILCHGITVTMFASIKYINIFFKSDYNVLIFDHRNHGNSGGKNTTFGYFEKYDLKIFTDWVFDRIGEDSMIGLHGESMGAAIALQNAGVDSRIGFVIADCPFSNLNELLKVRLKADYRLPAFPILNIANSIIKLKNGFNPKDILPIKDVEKSDIPMFFIHGEKDDYIPSEMSIKMYNVKQGIKKSFFPENVEHARAYVKNKKVYEVLVRNFIEEIESITIYKSKNKDS